MAAAEMGEGRRARVGMWSAAGAASHSGERKVEDRGDEGDGAAHDERKLAAVLGAVEHREEERADELGEVAGRVRHASPEATLGTRGRLADQDHLR